MANCGLPGVTRYRPLRCDETEHPYGSPAHSPCSRLYARLAEYVTVPAGRLLPYPFTPCRCACTGGTALCCGCSRYALLRQRPHLLFHEATVPKISAESREVPLPGYPAATVHLNYTVIK